VKSLLFRFVAFAIMSGLMPNMASACSMDLQAVKNRIEYIKVAPEVRRVRGVFKWTEIRGKRFIGDDGNEWIANAVIIGRLETKRGTNWLTFHDAPDDSTTCRYGSYFKPETDALGVFYISKRRNKDGRYELLHWESGNEKN